MSPNEQTLVKRAGCTPFVVLSYIKSNPERNSRMRISEQTNLSLPAVKSAVNKLLDMNIIREEEIPRDGSNMWNKKFVVKNETEWFQ